MSQSFTKLFSSLVTSTIWAQDDHTRLVWITLLALADRNGEVPGSIPGLAHVARVSIEACETALTKLMAPDPYSRTKTDEGRRIEEIDGGWALLNYQKYRAMASKEDQIEKHRERTRRYRAKRHRDGLTTVGDARAVEAEGDAEGEADKKAMTDMTSSVGATEGVTAVTSPAAAENVSHETPPASMATVASERPRFRPLVVDEPMTAAEVVTLQAEAIDRVMPPSPESVPADAETVEGVDPLDMPVFLDQGPCGAAVRLWNESCSRTGWPVVKKLSASRRAQLTARLQDAGGVRGWGEALALAEKSPFLTGRSGRGEGHENWQCNFDFLIKESKFLKLIEGGYNGLKPNDKRIEGLGGVLAGLHRAAANRQSREHSS